MGIQESGKVGVGIGASSAARWLALLSLLAALLASCGDTDGVISDTGSADPPVPGPDQPQLPLFQRPFEGTFPLDNYFDHDRPLGFVGTEYEDGEQLNWQNVRLSRVDGHAGYDWETPTGVPILAAAGGRVLFAGVEPPFYCIPQDREVDDQTLVEIEHWVEGQRFTSVYVHLSRIDVARGDVVEAGQVIGLAGGLGCSSSSHLHFQVWRLTGTNSGRPAPVDPYGWDAEAEDPWALNPDGAVSEWMWLPGEAPVLHTEGSSGST